MRYPCFIMAYVPQNQSQISNPSTQLKSLTVIVLALLGGMVTFSGLATYMALTKGPLMVSQNQPATTGAASAPTGDPTLILYIASGAFTAFSILAYVFLGKLAQSHINKRIAGVPVADREQAATPILMTNTIIRAGFAEGAGLFGAVIVLLTGTLYTLGAVAIAAVLLILLMPARARMESALAEASRTTST